MAYVGKIFKIRKGRKEIKSFTNTLLRYIQIDDLRNNNNLKYCVKNPRNVLCDPSDILIAWDGANAGTIGYGLKGAIGSTIAKLSTERKDFYIPYAGKFLQSKSKHLRERCTGATIPHISRNELDRIKIPLPPLETQQKIAAILDKADELVQNDKKILEKYDQLARSVFLEMFGDPVLNPMKWRLSKLSELGIWKSGGTPSRQIADYFNGGIPWLTSGELENIYTFESIEQISEQAIKESSTKLIEKESLLLGMYDTAALKSTINKIECSCNQAIAFAKLDNKRANTVFVYYFIQFGKDFLRRMQRGVRQKNMNLSMIKDLQIFLPPIILQNRFAEIIKHVETQKQVALQSLQKSEELFQSLVQGVFRVGGKDDEGG